MSRANAFTIPFGSIVDATVYEIEGAHINTAFNGTSIIIQIPEIAWLPNRMDLSKEYHIGDVIKVKVLRYMPDDRRYVGSIRQTCPETNPLIPYAERGIAATYDAEIIEEDSLRFPGFGQVKLPDGIKGAISLIGSGHKRGDRIRVYAIEIDPGGFHATFEIADEQ